MKWYKKKPISIFIKNASDKTGIPIEHCEHIIDSFFTTIVKNFTKVHVFKLPHFGKVTTIRFKNRKKIDYVRKENTKKLTDDLESLNFDDFINNL